MDYFYSSPDKVKEECLPIKTLEDFRTWNPSNCKKHNIYPLEKRVYAKDSPKTLVCHDMKGGYLEDRFLNGTETEDNYYFIHWSMVDIFVYFSHHLVTIPPCGWISAAHRNGVKILGTFITEWDAGAEVCASILSDISAVQDFCMKLVRIAEFFQFDGWLINIENKINQNQVPFLEEFVKFLTLKMHESQPKSLVIWYDSVIETGELKWQNELNKYNRNFFFECDGIFLNYNWTKDNLRTSVVEASPRTVDVFVGVDVFGRGCLGGGGFSTDIAVTAARDFNLSVAIFAPGWVYECHDVKDFKENQYKFWNSLIELCAPRVIEGLPYYTSFCPGFGKKMFRLGKVEHDKQWSNLSLQQPQPTFHYTNCSTEGSMLTVHSEDAYNGGGCLLLTCTIPNTLKVSKFEILSSNFLIKDTCCISYTFKPLNKNTKVALIFSMYNKKEFYDVCFLDKADDPYEERVACLCLSCWTSEARKISPTSVKITSGSNEEQAWIKRKYKVYCHKEECFVKKVSIQVSCEETPATEVSILLGELLISPSTACHFTYKDFNVIQEEESRIVIECLLEWSLDSCIHFSDLYVVINEMKSYVCTTSQFCYKFRGSVHIESEIQFVLRPKCFGKTIQPMSLRISPNFLKHKISRKEK